MLVVLYTGIIQLSSFSFGNIMKISMSLFFLAQNIFYPLNVVSVFL